MNRKVLVVINKEVGSKRTDSRNSNYRVDTDNIKVEKKVGGSINDTSLIEGIVLDKEVDSRLDAKEN